MKNNDMSDHPHDARTQPLYSFQNDEGAIPYNMTNDYMFRAVLQKNQRVLKGLICSLLHLSPEKINSIEIQNPIILGESMDYKEFVMDLKVVLNNQKHINLEMQMSDEHNWPERSLSYVCREFDNISRGSDYLDVAPVIHIGFLNFTLFEDAPEFYATYKMSNLKNHRIYSDKLCIHVVELNHIELATDEDKAYQIDYWAAAFKAKTWKELIALAANNTYIADAAQTMYDLNSDWLVQEQCRRLEDFYIYQRTLENMVEKKDKEIASMKKELEELRTLISSSSTSQ